MFDVTAGLICTGLSHHNPIVFEKRLDTAIGVLLDKITQMNDEEFTVLRRAVDDRLRKPMRNLHEKAELNFKQIISECKYLDRDRNKNKGMDSLQEMDLEKFVQNQLLTNASHRRKFSFHYWPNPVIYSPSERAKICETLIKQYSEELPEVVVV